MWQHGRCAILKDVREEPLTAYERIVEDTVVFGAASIDPSWLYLERFLPAGTEDAIHSAGISEIADLMFAGDT